MMKEVIRDLASGALPLIGTLAFISAFVLIVIRVALLSKKDVEHLQNIPLNDEIDILTPTETHSHE